MLAHVPDKLRLFFVGNPRVALAFSGGVDSAYLLYAAAAAGAEVKAYYVNTAFQPEFEKEDARRFARQLEAQLVFLPLEILENRAVAANGENRCYHCKKEIFSAIWRQAQKDGFSLLIDGSNASDQEGERPGMRALKELEVRSPLRECGLTKRMIRAYSKEAGLFTWNKPAYACLATRVPVGVEITAGALRKTEQAESALEGMGFVDFRVRLQNGAAVLQVPAWQMGQALEKRGEILETLGESHQAVYLDLLPRKEEVDG